VQDTREELRTLCNDYHRVSSENEELDLMVCRNNEKVSRDTQDLAIVQPWSLLLEPRNGFIHSSIDTQTVAGKGSGGGGFIF